MATSPPPASSSTALPTAPGPAPSAPPSEGAGQATAQPGAEQQPADLASAISQALNFGQPSQTSQPAQQPGAAPDPLADILAGLPPDHPAHAAIQGLRANDGRWRAAQRQQAAQQQQPDQGAPTRDQQIAEALLIADVRKDPTRLHELAAFAGVEPADLARAAGIDPGQQAAPGFEAGQRRGLNLQLLSPKLTSRMWDIFTERSSPKHEKSWTAPIVAARQQANQLRVGAFEALADARLTEDPRQKASLEARAQQDQARAEELELQSITDHTRSVYEFINATMTPLREQLAEMIHLVQSVQEQDRAESQQSAAYNQMLNSARADTADDGSARFGPAGYGIFDVDAAGNCAGVSEMGQRALAALPSVMQQHGLPMPADLNQLEAALRLLSTYAPSDGQTSAAAVQNQAGDQFAQPGQWAPDAGGQRPSLPGNGSAAPRY